MKSTASRITLLALAIGIAVAGTTLAQDAPKAPTPAQRKELDAARARLDDALEDYAELSRKYGRGTFDIALDDNVFRKPVLGVVLAPADEGGVRIAGVTPGGAAAEAGLAGGDRIIAIDGKALAGSDAEARLEAAREAIAAHDEDSRVQLRYVRAGKEASVAIAPRIGERVMFVDRAPMAMPDRVRIHTEVAAAHEAARAARAALPGIRRDADAARDEAERMAALAPRLRREVVHLRECQDPPCAFPVLAEALRWNGLNLATLDADLGTYFGTRKGVLVVSAAPELKGLHSGDVILSVDGKPVDSPREVMDALRGRKTGERVELGYLRNHQAGTTMISVPEPMRFPVPPAPPAPPAPPPPPAPPARGAVPAPAAPPAPATPPAPPAPPPPPVD